jgi:hypothetical protein
MHTYILNIMTHVEDKLQIMLMKAIVTYFNLILPYIPRAVLINYKNSLPNYSYEENVQYFQGEIP